MLNLVGSLSLVINELESVGVNVNTPVPLLYAKLPLPLLLAVVTLTSLSRAPWNTWAPVAP